LRGSVGMRRGEGPMVRAEIRRLLSLLGTWVVLASGLLAGAANWPKT
jgi:hypothetical protein